MSQAEGVSGRRGGRGPRHSPDILAPLGEPPGHLRTLGAEVAVGGGFVVANDVDVEALEQLLRQHFDTVMVDDVDVGLLGEQLAALLGGAVQDDDL